MSILTRFKARSELFANLSFGLFFIAILSYGAFFAYYLLSHSDLVNFVAGGFNNDDAFYYFQIAKNLAAGEFSTFDGGITRTNGYHPVWLLLITPFYWVFDLEEALFAIKGFEIVLVACGVAAIALAARLFRLPWIVLFAVLPTLYVHTALYRGLEAAAGLFALGLLFLALSLFARNPTRWSPLLAGVAFVLPWVRLEYLAISLTGTASIALIEWLRHPQTLSVRALARIRLPSSTLTPLLSACLGGLTYFVYNRLAFGGLVPVSRAAKQVWSQLCFEGDIGLLPPLAETLYGPRCLEEGSGFDIIENLRDFLRLGVFDGELLVAGEICVYALLVWWLARRSPSKSDRFLLLFLVGAASLAIGHSAKFAHSVLTVHPTWGRADWYFVPAYLMMAIIVPIRCFVVIYLIGRFVEPRWQSASRVLKPAAIAMAVLILIPHSSVLTNLDNVDRVTDDNNAPPSWDMSRYLGTIQVMNNILPEYAIVGSWDAGRIGYFSNFQVVNLDGLVNSYEYLNASKTGNGDKLFGKYGITHFANILSVHDTLDNTLYEGISIRNTYEFKLWAGDGADLPAHSDSVWNKLESRFDHQSNGIGVMLSGRLAQVIARDCAPDQLHDVVIVFSWDDGTVASAGYPWRNIRENNLGYCVEGIELPSAMMQPVRIEIMSKPDYARLEWEKLGPQFDYRWDEAGVTVDDRQVQVLARDCRLERLQDMVLVASWDDDESVVSVGYLMSHMGNSRTACVDAFKLPNDVVHPVRIELISKEAYADGLIRGRPPVARSDWDVYISDDHKLVYKKDQCSQADVAARFFLHPIPDHRLAMPFRRWPYGFDNLDFRFEDFGFRFDDTCIAVRELPAYRIESIRTGQYTGENRLWEVNHTLAR